MKLLMMLVLMASPLLGDEGLVKKYSDLAGRYSAVVGELVAETDSHAKTLRIVRDLEVLRFREATRALGSRVVAFVNGISLIGGSRISEDAVKTYYAQACGCLVAEVDLRERWAEMAKGKMTQVERDEIGEEWLKMQSQMAGLVEILEAAEPVLEDVAGKALAFRKAARGRIKAGEPEIVE